MRNRSALTQVEPGFRTLWTADLQLRPIHHRLADRMRVYLFLRFLAYYMEWPLREAWRPPLLADDELAERCRTRDSLLEALASVTRNVCRATGAERTRQTEFERNTQLSADLARARSR